MKSIFILLMITVLASCKQPIPEEKSTEEIPHYLRKDNFTVLRVIIKNDKEQILMTNDAGYWGMPWVNLTKRQFLNEAIDSMATEHGVKLKDLKLAGQFCFKYDYKPPVTFRNYYTASYERGELKTPTNSIETKFQGIEWVDESAAIERLDNKGIRAITEKILNSPDTIWGASFMVSHTDEDHPTKIVEPFYSLGSKN